METVNQYLNAKLTMAQNRSRIQSITVLCVMACVTLYSLYQCLPTQSTVATVQLLDTRQERINRQSLTEKEVAQSANRSNTSELDAATTMSMNYNANHHAKDSKALNQSQTGGYVLAGDYWEQLSSASRNLQNLQCWAGKVGVRVVEPFSMQSVLRTPLSLVQAKNRFSNFVDLASWNEESKKLGNTELVSWEMFLKQAPRDIIAVEFRFPHSTTSREVQRELKENPGKYPPIREERLKLGCSSWPKSHPAGFKIVRKVCLNFEYGDVLTMKEFIDGIYDTFDPQKTTVYFKQWRGLSNYARIPVQQSGCYNTGIQEHMPPSPKLKNDTEEYIVKYLTGNDYIAIIGRLEKSRISLKKRLGVVNYCLDQALQHWKKLSSKTGLSATFLSIDMGKYGSNSFKYDQKDFADFFSALYGDYWSVSDWERSFEETAETKDSGYIALLQKIIVTRAKCIIFVGGGSFQKHALALYQSRVPSSEWCLDVVKECTQDKNLRLH